MRMLLLLDEKNDEMLLDINKYVYKREKFLSLQAVNDGKENILILVDLHDIT